MIFPEKIELEAYVNRTKSVSDLQILIKYVFLLYFPRELLMSFTNNFKKFINNSQGKYKRNECLINVCKSDKDLS